MAALGLSNVSRSFWPQPPKDRTFLEVRKSQEARSPRRELRPHELLMRCSSVKTQRELCRIIQHLGGGNDSERGRSQYTSTSAVASLACSNTSSNFMSFAFGSLSLAAISGTDSRKLSKKLLFTA